VDVTITSAKRINVAEELIGNSPSVRGDKVAYYCGDARVTYKRLAQNINKFANVLKDMGVRPTERVMIVMPDCPMFVYAFLGSIKYGAWPVPVNTTLGDLDYHYLLTHSEARVVVTIKDGKATRAKTEHTCEKVFPLEDEFTKIFDAASTEADPYLVAPEDIAFWLYTSGSTGKPKGTQHKQASMLYTADNYAKSVLQISEDDVCFSVSKLYFAYGLGNSVSFPLRFGASAVLLADMPTPDNVLDTLEKFEPTVFFGVPTQYNSVLKKIDTLHLPGLRACVSAGEALPPEILKQWRVKTGLDILDGIGSTEALHIFISNRAGDVKEGTSGRLVPGYEARVVDDSGKELPNGETGHLVIRGGSITPGYWNRPEDNAERILEGGWFKTGDMYSKEGDYFTYHGRADDMLKVGGIWVSPVEIEYTVMDHKAVSECAVVGHEVEGLVKPFAYVTLNDSPDTGDNDRLIAELIEFVAEKLPKFKRPWGINFVKELPKTDTGKLQRYKLRQQK
jgi:benzoate-CoA ligase family protein